MDNRNYNFKNIAVFSISGIGNTIFAIPMLGHLRRSFKNVKITLFVRFEATKSLYNSCPYVDDIQVIDYAKYEGIYKKIKLIKDMRKEKFDLIITAFPSEKRDKNMFSYIVGAPVRLGHKYIKNNFFDFGFLQTDRVLVDITIHDLDQNLNLLTLLGIDITDADRTLQVWIPEQNRLFAIDYLKQVIGVDNYKNKLLVGFHAGSSSQFGMDYKRWDYKNFAQLGDMICDKYDAKILLFGGPEEKELKSKIAQSMKHKPIIVEKTSIQKDAAIIKNCQMFISNDSGNMNLALALGVFTIGLFGPVGSVRANLKNKQHKIIESPASCSPCWSLANISDPLICPHSEIICMKQIKVDQVFMAVEEHINEIKVNNKANKTTDQVLVTD